MTDVHNKKTRSYNMSMIRSKDTKPEILVRKCLFAKGFRYKTYNKTLPTSLIPTRQDNIF
jgi:DNA mismatch endonuclease (patch repair protein)